MFVDVGVSYVAGPDLVSDLFGAHIFGISWGLIHIGADPSIRHCQVYHQSGPGLSIVWLV